MKNLPKHFLTFRSFTLSPCRSFTLPLLRSVTLWHSSIILALLRSCTHLHFPG